MSNRSHQFRNWSRTVEFRPNNFRLPTTEPEIAEIVRQAAADGTRVRTQGAGHSFSQIVTTNDMLLSLDKQEEVFLRSGKDVTVHAGIRLKDLIKKLKKLDTPLGLANIGSVTEQSIAGAISTGTHGTGLGLGSMSTQVVGVRLIDGKGAVHDIDGTALDDLRAARVSIGLLGVITQVTLACVDYFDVDYDVYLCDYDDVIANIDHLARQNQRVLLWWLFPLVPRDKVLVVTKNDVGGKRAGFLERSDDLVDEVGGRLPTGTLSKDFEDLGGALARTGHAAGCKHILHRSGGYEKMLTIPLLPVYHRECEYAIPVENTAAALATIRSIFDEADFKLRLPMEVRFVAADENPLSPSHGRDVCYIGVATLDNAAEVFERFEPLMKDLGGRPHWGKHFNLRRQEVERMYPDAHASFVATRRRYDPSGVFLNSLLARLFQ